MNIKPKTARRQRLPRTRRFILGLRRRLRPFGRVVATGALTGLGTYAALRFGGHLLSPLARARSIRRFTPRLAGEIEAMRGSAVNWGLGGGILAAATKARDEGRGWGRRRWRQWLKTGRF